AMTNRKVLSTPGHLMSVAARGFVRLSESRLRPLGFGPGYLPVLTALRDGLADTQRDLARVVKMGQPPMAQMLARMERDGLVARMPDPEDGRSRKIALTSKAEDGLPAAIAVLMEGNGDALAGFTEEETTQLLAMLERVIANLGRAANDEGKQGA
ncbi:MarR family transcriptional regulator, partial [uncultured Jannaschia sp.]|uniref:MarR family winged helix-turn-helix transcriptional regulator n=1 Tax=uncultured Jannaschia sp. TaxID=293347 RepID=UPI00260657B3